MAYSKGSPLFDAMSRQRQRSPEAALPGWVPEDEPAPAPPQYDPYEDDEVDAVRHGWFGQTLVLAVRRQTALVVSVMVLMTIIGTGILGWSIGVNQEREKFNDREVYAGNMLELRAKPVNPTLWVNLEDHRTFTSNEATANRPVTPTSSNGDVRQHGHNYFILMSIKSSHREEADRASKFLNSNGVDAAVLATKNRSVVLVVLEGFAPPLRPQQSKIDALRNKLKALGRRWKADHKGSTNWYDLYLDKH